MATGRISESPANFAQTLARGLRLLTLLKDGPCSRAEMERRSGMERSALYRLLRTLEAEGFIIRDRNDGTYRLGLLLWELGAAARGELEVGLAATAGPLIRDLAERCGESVHLSVYDSGEIVYIDKAEGSNPIRSYTRLGGRAPAYCVATGKALLAHQPEQEQRRVAESELVRYTDMTIVTERALLKELEVVREVGFAINRGEWRAEVGGIAVPILDRMNEPVAALGVSGPLKRVEADRQRLVTEVWRTCKQVRAGLHWGESEPTELFVARQG